MEFVCKCHGREFKNNHSLHDHLVKNGLVKKVIPVNIIKFKCFHCNKKYRSLTALDNHLEKLNLVRKDKYFFITPNAEEIIKLYEKNMSIKQIALKFKVSTPVIYRELKKVNYQLKVKKHIKGEVICSHCNNKYKNQKALETHLWNVKNPLKSKNYKLKNKEKILVVHKIYDDAHKEEKSKFMQSYYINNKETHDAKVREYQQTFKGKSIMKACSHNRRVNLQNSSKLTSIEIGLVYKKCTNEEKEYICICCFKPIMKGQEEIEHDIPISRVNDFPNVDLNNINNLGLAHKSCNVSKYNLTLDEWFQKHPELLENKECLQCC